MENNNKQTNSDLFEDYKRKVLDGCADVTYPSNIENEVIDYLISYKDKNDNVLFQYARNILDGEIKTSNNYKDAFDILHKLSINNNFNAQCRLGICYYYGQGIEQDYTKAVYWFKKTAEQGNALAQCYLGSCFYNGQGVEQDYTQAFNWYKKSAEQGIANAQFNLGNLYDRGY